MTTDFKGLGGEDVGDQFGELENYEEYEKPDNMQVRTWRKFPMSCQNKAKVICSCFLLSICISYITGCCGRTYNYGYNIKKVVVTNTSTGKVRRFFWGHTRKIYIKPNDGIKINIYYKFENDLWKHKEYYPIKVTGILTYTKKYWKETWIGNNVQCAKDEDVCRSEALLIKSKDEVRNGLTHSFSFGPNLDLFTESYYKYDIKMYSADSKYLSGATIYIQPEY